MRFEHGTQSFVVHTVIALALVHTEFRRSHGSTPGTSGTGSSSFLSFPEDVELKKEVRKKHQRLPIRPLFYAGAAVGVELKVDAFPLGFAVFR